MDFKDVCMCASVHVKLPSNITNDKHKDYTLLSSSDVLALNLQDNDILLMPLIVPHTSCAHSGMSSLNAITSHRIVASRSNVVYVSVLEVCHIFAMV